MSASREQWVRTTSYKIALMNNACEFVTSLRTTLCDIQCTTNTPFPVESLPPPPESMKQLSATLPYDTPYSGMIGPMKSTTKFQKFKTDDSVLRKMADLKRDKEAFFRKLNQEKSDTTRKRTAAATVIQRYFRGFRVRKPKLLHCYQQKRKPVAFLTNLELYDELCKMAADLRLDPIPGMSLEFRTKASKRQVRIENAAAFRLQSFFRMIYQRNMARVVMELRRQEKINKAARVVTKAIRFVITKKFVKRVDNMKRVKMSVKIQSHVRAYQSRLRVKDLKKQQLVDYRRNEAAIVIQRNLSSHTKDSSRLANITLRSLRSFRKMLNMVTDRIAHVIIDEWLNQQIDFYLHVMHNVVDPAIDVCANVIVDENVNTISSFVVNEFVIEIIRVIDEENRRLAIERMRLEEEMNMCAEETFSREHVSQLPVVTKQMIREMTTQQTARELIDGILDVLLAEERERQRLAEELRQQQLLAKKHVEETQQAAETLAEQTVAIVVAEKERRVQFYHASAVLVRDATAEGLRTVSQILASSVVLLDNNNDANASMMMNEVDALRSLTGSQLEDMSFDAAHLSIVGNSALASQFDPDSSQILEQLSETDIDQRYELVPNAEPAVTHTNEEDISVHSEASQASTFSKTHNPNTVASKAALSIQEIAQYTGQGKHQRAIQELNSLMSKMEQKLVTIRKNESQSLSEPVMRELLSKHSIVYTVLGLLKARNLFALGAYEESYVLFEGVRQIREQLLGEDHYLYGEILFFLAEWHRGFAQYEQAEQFYKHADAILVKEMYSFDNADDLVSETSQYSALPSQLKVNLAPKPMDDESVRSKGDEQDNRSLRSTYSTEADIEHAEIHSQSLPNITIFKLYHRNLIAYTELLRQDGQYYKSYEMLKKTQASLLYFKQFDLASFEVKEDFLMTLIHVFVSRGNYTHAIELHVELLDKRRVHYGERHPKVATSLACLGKLYLTVAQYGQAAQSIEDCLSMRYEFYGNAGMGLNSMDSISLTSMHPKQITGQGLEVDSHVLLMGGSPVDDIHIQNSSVRHCLHPAIAHAHWLKCEGFVALGKYAEALVEARRALEIFSELFRVRTNGLHPAIGQCLQSIGKVYNAMGEPLHAKNALEDSLVLFTRVFHFEHHIKLLETLTQIALALVNRGLHSIALETFQFVRTRRETVLQMNSLSRSQINEEVEKSSPGHPHNSAVDFHLVESYRALCLMHSGTVSESKRVAKSAVHQLQQVFGQSHPAISRSLNNLAEICKIQGSHGDARALGGLAYDIFHAIHGMEHEYLCTIMRESADNIRLPGFYRECLHVLSMATDLANKCYCPIEAMANHHSTSLTAPSHVIADPPLSAASELVAGESIMGPTTGEEHQLSASELQKESSQEQIQQSGPSQQYFVENVHQGKLFLLQAIALRDLSEMCHWADYVNNGYTPPSARDMVFVTPDLLESERLLVHSSSIFLEKAGENSSWYLNALLQLGDVYRLQRNFIAAERCLLHVFQLSGVPLHAFEMPHSQGHAHKRQELPLRDLLVLLDEGSSVSVVLQQHRAHPSVTSPLHMEGVDYAEALLAYSLFLMDTRQYQNALRVMLELVLPLVSQLLGANHSLSHFCNANAQLCQLFMSWDEQSTFRHGILSALAGDVQSMSSANDDDQSAAQSVLCSMLQDMKDSINSLPAVQEMLQYWQSMAFSVDHCWLRRLQLAQYLYIDACVLFGPEQTPLMAPSVHSRSLYDHSHAPVFSFSASQVPSHRNSMVSAITGVTIGRGLGEASVSFEKSVASASGSLSRDGRSHASENDYESNTFYSRGSHVSAASEPTESVNHSTASVSASMGYTATNSEGVSAQDISTASAVNSASVSQSTALSNDRSSTDTGSGHRTAEDIETEAYAKALSVISEGDDRTAKSSRVDNDSYSRSAGQSMGTGRSSSPRTNDDRLFDDNSLSYASAASQSDRLGTADNRSVESDWESRSYVSLISRISKPSRADNDSLVSAAVRDSAATPRDSPRSVMSGVSFQSLSTSYRSKFSQVEDQTIQSWVTGFYSQSARSASLTHTHGSPSYAATASYSASVMTPGSLESATQADQSMDRSLEEGDQRSESYEKESELSFDGDVDNSTAKSRNDESYDNDNFEADE